MELTPFEKRIFDQLRRLLRAEKDATEEGNADSVMLCRAEYAGFVAAMRLTLSERLCVKLERRAVENVNGIT